MKKFKVVLIILFAIPLMTACCNEDTYELTITGVETRAFILDENNARYEFDRQDPIDKSDLILAIEFTEVEEITSNQVLDKERTGVRVMDAAVVPYCEDQVLIYKNSVERVKIEIIDTENNNTKMDITDQFVVIGSQVSISQYISENIPGLRGFEVTLTDIRNIPDRIEYEIEVTLDDGSQVLASGGEIRFN